MAKQIMFEKVREDYYKLFAYSKQHKEWVYLDEYHTKDIARVVDQLNVETLVINERVKKK